MFEIVKINEDGSKEVIGTTDINLASVDATYNLLEAKVSSTLDKFMESRDLDGKDKVTLLASTINNIVNQAMTAPELTAKLEQSKLQEEKLKYDIATLKASLEKQYGAKINSDTGILEFIEEKSVISEQIDGFRQSGIKEIYKSSMQGIGMIYNAGETIPSWLVDITKRTAEILGCGDIDFKKNTTTSETEMTPETTWDK